MTAEPKLKNRIDPIASSPNALATMKANKGKDTRPEVELRAQLHRAGLRFFKNRRIDFHDGRVRPDIVFPTAKLAVFVDGCFWHGCDVHRVEPKSNSDFWRQKVAATRSRDMRDNALLATHGWTVVRVWEHDPPQKSSAHVISVLASLRQAPDVEN